MFLPMATMPRVILLKKNIMYLGKKVNTIKGDQSFQTIVLRTFVLEFIINRIPQRCGEVYNNNMKYACTLCTHIYIVIRRMAWV